MVKFIFFVEEEKDGENTASIWEEVWSEATPGTEAGLKLYLKVKAVFALCTCI